MEYFSAFINVSALIYIMFLVVRFFYRVFKNNAKVIWDLRAIILIGIVVFLFSMSLIVKSVGPTMVLFMVTALPKQRIFAYNDEILIFSNSICRIDQTKIESEKVIFISRVTITTNQKGFDGRQIVLSLTPKNSVRFKTLLG